MTDGLDTHSTNLSAVPGLAPQGDSPAPSTDGSGAVCGGGTVGASVQPATFRFPALAGRKRRQRVGGAFFAAGDAERELLAKQLSLLVTAEEVEAIMRQVRGESDGAGESLASGIDGADAASEEARREGDAMAVNTEATDIDSGNASAIPPSIEASDVLSGAVAHKADAVSEATERIINKNAFEEPIRCPIPGCHVVVQGALALDAHHQAMHRAMCATCSKAFPSNRLLNIHVAEAHDSFFQAKVARGVAMYECLVETCTHRFPSDAVVKDAGGGDVADLIGHMGARGDAGVTGGVDSTGGTGGAGTAGTVGTVKVSDAVYAVPGGDGTPTCGATENLEGPLEAAASSPVVPDSGGMDVDKLAVAVSRLSTSDFVPRSLIKCPLPALFSLLAAPLYHVASSLSSQTTPHSNQLCSPNSRSSEHPAFLATLHILKAPSPNSPPTLPLSSFPPSLPLRLPLSAAPFICPFHLPFSSAPPPSFASSSPRPPAHSNGGGQTAATPASCRQMPLAGAAVQVARVHWLAPAVHRAMAAAPKGAVIYVRAGVYEEQVRVRQDRVVLVGEGHMRTVIRAGRNQAEGTPLMDTATLSIYGSNFVGMGLGVENTAGPQGKQAVAARSDGDKTAFYHCRFSGYQDTLFAQEGRHYYSHCLIEGTTDFIFGHAAAVFYRCALVARPSPEPVYVAASGRASASEGTGFVFIRSEVKGSEPGTQASQQGRVYLARPWGMYARTVFIESRMSSVVNAEGWAAWHGRPSSRSPFFAEYGSHGPGAAEGRRAAWVQPKVLTKEQLKKFWPGRFIRWHTWKNQTRIPC
ncbi:unnamed protein product [Closterium sp. NIES-65]|nr:unnamed protein product [Closterium sp. NIES-65]